MVAVIAHASVHPSIHFDGHLISGFVLVGNVGGVGFGAGGGVEVACPRSDQGGLLLLLMMSLVGLLVGMLLLVELVSTRVVSLFTELVELVLAKSVSVSASPLSSLVAVPVLLSVVPPSLLPNIVTVGTNVGFSVGANKEINVGGRMLSLTGGGIESLGGRDCIVRRRMCIHRPACPCVSFRNCRYLQHWLSGCRACPNCSYQKRRNCRL